MSNKSLPFRMFTGVALALGITAGATVLGASPSAVASPSASVYAFLAPMPVQVNGEWFKIQSSWLEQCSASLYIQTVGGHWPSENASDYTKVPRGVKTFIRPADNGGNDGDFYWRCGTTEERSDAPGNGFHTLQVKHSDTSREISMIALDKCGNGTSLQQCF